MRFLILAVSVAAVVGLVSACDNGSSGGESSTSSYQGAGSRYTAAFSGGSFEVKKYSSASATTADVTVNGTYVDYSTGFRKLTVTSATGTGAPAAGVTAYGLEIPGLAFILKPAGDANSEPIAMVAAGTCPTSNFNANWIATDFQASSVTDNTQDAFGTAAFTINGSSSSATITRKTFVNGSNLSDTSISFNSGNCSNGVLDVGGGVEMYLSTAGGALVKTTGSFIFAAPQQSADMVAADLNGTYSGVAFIADGTDKQIPVKIVFSGGNGTAQQLTDIENDTTGAGSVTFSSVTPIASTNGLFYATAVNGSDTGRVNCATFTFGGKRVIGCNGFFRNDTGDVDGDSNTSEKAPFFFVARVR